MAADGGRGYDFVVIGSGPGGYTAAIRASQLGMRTGIIEEAELGGVCLNWGCIPAKALLRSAELFSMMRRARTLGLSAGDVGFEWGRVIERSRMTANRMSKGVGLLMKQNGIDVLTGRGRLGPQPSTVLIGEERITAKKIMIATGGRARVIPGVPFDGERIITSREAMILAERPERLLVVGAGATGVEFAYIYAMFGTKVTLVEMLPHLLPLEDEEIGRELQRSFSKKGIVVRVGTEVTSLTREGAVVRTTLSGPKGEEEIEADIALVAIGVTGNVENLGLEEAGVVHEGGVIKVDQEMRTSAAGIVAIGDIIGPPFLAHVAAREGIVAVEALAGKRPSAIDYGKVPSCTYCHPQVGSVGLTERAAREEGIAFKVGKFPMQACGKAVAAGATEGFAKVLVGEKDGKILGVHIIGSDATEVIAEASLALTSGATAETILATIHAHPTIAEVIHEATGNALGESINI